MVHETVTEEVWWFRRLRQRKCDGLGGCDRESVMVQEAVTEEV